MTIGRGNDDRNKVSNSYIETKGTALSVCLEASHNVSWELNRKVHLRLSLLPCVGCEAETFMITINQTEHDFGVQIWIYFCRQGNLSLCSLCILRGCAMYDAQRCVLYLEVKCEFKSMLGLWA
jgi:hypothetical protein